MLVTSTVQSASSMSVAMASSPTTEPSFIPRKEFIRIPLAAPDSFALLTLSSSNCIRLYSFPASVVDALQLLLEQLSVLLSWREDSPQRLYEFALDGKPWTNAKSVSTEKLLLDILAVIYQSGYNYLSTIDYGRENDDRLSMVFSKPGTLPLPTSPTISSLPPSIPAISTSASSDKEKDQRTHFAISFASATVMRVIEPPLHLTPAILQAVRASWPRGVVSEKKVGNNSFEFRLKGYKWFQQDTFATDSLRHILALLTSLDSHSFSLLTSLSLTHRSRVKDLWIFTGPAPESSLPAEMPLANATIPDVRRIPLQGFSTEASQPMDAQQQHKRSATEPTAHQPSPQHSRSRSTTDGLQRQPSQSSQPHLLRKPAPRAQVPISVFLDSVTPEEHHPVVRAHMPSTISTGAENMTGVGALGLKSDVLSTSSPPATPPLKVDGPAAHPRSDLVATPPLLPSASPKHTPQSNEKPIPSANDFSSPPLLGIDTFRDPSFSSNPTNPIPWTGSYKGDVKLEQEKPTRVSVRPMFPGGWPSTPVDDTLEFSIPISSRKGTPSTPIHENDCHIEAPAMITPDMPLRKSEAALVGIIASTSHLPSIPQRDKESQSSGGQGWVLVNVEGSNPAKRVLGSESAGPSGSVTSRPHESKSPLSTSFSAPSSSKSPALEQPSSAAKAIVIIDAMDSKQKKRSNMQPKENGEGSTGLKGFFSLNKKSLGKATEAETPGLKSIPRFSLRDRLRQMGTPEASRREGKRRSID